MLKPTEGIRPQLIRSSRDVGEHHSQKAAKELLIDLSHAMQLNLECFG